MLPDIIDKNHQDIMDCDLDSFRDIKLMLGILHLEQLCFKQKIYKPQAMSLSIYEAFSYLGINNESRL